MVAKNAPLVYRLVTESGSEYKVDIYGQKITLVQTPGSKGTIHSYESIGVLPTDVFKDAKTIADLRQEASGTNFEDEININGRLYASIESGVMISSPVKLLEIFDSISGKIVDRKSI